MKYSLSILAVIIGFTVAAEPSKSGSFMKQQAAAEVQRISGQMDVLSENQEALADRVTRVEAQKKEIESLKAEIAALKVAVEQLKADLNAEHGKIVGELSKKIAALPPPAPTKTSSKASPVSSPADPAELAKCQIYTVQSGDSLFFVARAFDTSVAKLKQLNGLKNDKLSIGQTLYVPRPKE